MLALQNPHVAATPHHQPLLHRSSQDGGGRQASWVPKLAWIRWPGTSVIRRCYPAAHALAHRWLVWLGRYRWLKWVLTLSPAPFSSFLPEAGHLAAERG